METIRLTARLSRRTLYFWLERLQRNGGEELIDASRRTRTICCLNPSPLIESSKSNNSTDGAAKPSRLVQFTTYLRADGIERAMGSNGRYTTQDKIEHFLQTFGLYYPGFNDMTELLQHCEYVRPHRGLDFLTPAKVC